MEYKKYMGNVCIFENTDLTEVNEHVANLQKENDKLKAQVKQLNDTITQGGLVQLVNNLWQRVDYCF